MHNELDSENGYVIANCDGCSENAENDFTKCVECGCLRLEFASKTVRLNPLGGSQSGMGAELHQYEKPSFGVWGDSAVVLSLSLPHGDTVDVWLDKKELAAALEGATGQRGEKVREHVRLEALRPARTKVGNCIFSVDDCTFMKERL